jgi:hypothetical protein
VFADRVQLCDVFNENAIFLRSIYIATILFAGNGASKSNAPDITFLEYFFFDGHIFDNLERLSSF